MLNQPRDKKLDLTELDLKKPNDLLIFVTSILTEQAMISHQQFEVADLRAKMPTLASNIVETISLTSFPITNDDVYEACNKTLTSVVRKWLSQQGLKDSELHHTSNIWAGRLLENLNKHYSKT